MIALALTFLMTTGSMAAVRPRISSISPTSGPTAGGTSVAINGSGFQAGATATIGGKSAVIVSVAPSSINAVTPAHTAGTVSVVVTNPGGLKGWLLRGYTYVNLGQPPQISSVSPTSGPTAGGTSVTITGSGFQAGAAVTIGGTSATVVSVAPSSITIVTPAHAAGMVNVVVTNPGGLMATLRGYTYVDRLGGGTLLWQFVLDGSYSLVRPAVGPDGTVYAIDVSGTLLAVKPDGTLLWKVVGAGGKGLAVSPDGTVYVGSESFVRAYRPDGTQKWSFQQSPAAYLFVGLGVGPDGNLYCLGTNGLGIFSLTPQGTLRWASSELFNQPIVSYGEIAFGPGPTPSSPKQLYFYANHHLRALTLDGRDVFLLGSGGIPVVSPFDGTMHVDKSAYFPDGAQYWFNFDIIGGSYVVMGRDGTHYQTAYIYPNELYALDPAGALKWTGVGGDYLTVSGVDPSNTRVLVVGKDAVDFTGLIAAYDTATGSRVWRLRLPPFQGVNQTSELLPGFSADGSVAYYVTTPCKVSLNHACLTAVAVK
jgi:hypothetical protein